LLSLRRLLPFPRDLAATAVWHDLGALFAGRPPGNLPVAEARRRSRLIAGEDLLARGDPDGAIRVADALLAAGPPSVPALRLRLAAEQASGRSRAALRTVQAIRNREDSARLADLEVRLAGTILVEETDWVPLLPPRPPCRNPQGPAIVIIPPEHGRGPQRAGSLDAVLRDLAEADLRPVAIPPPGSPAPASAADGGLERAATRWHPLDLGPAYPADPPADRLVLDHAWAAAAAARTIQPSLVIALVPHGDEHCLAVGLALGAAIGCPVAAIVGPGSTPDHAARPGTGRLRRADRVITTGAADDPALGTALRALVSADAGVTATA